MEVSNRGNSKSTTPGDVLSSWMLISPQNSSIRGLSLQISEIPVGSEQPVHCHSPEQCYYVIRGRGMMTIEDETQEVGEGDAVYIPGDAAHGIKNVGDEILEYLTVNSPPFGEDYEDVLWRELAPQEGATRGFDR